MKTFIIAALTADGFIGRHGLHAANWTSNEDKKLFVRVTKAAGTMIMGANTFSTIGRALPERRTIVYTSKTIQPPIGVETTKLPPAQLLKNLATEGVTEVAICGGAQIYSLFLDAGLVDELYLSIEPELFGTGIPLLAATSTVHLSLIETSMLNDNVVLLHYAVGRDETTKTKSQDTN